MKGKNIGQIKSSSIDILKFMGKVVEKHTKYYQSDFLIDKKMLLKAADRKELHLALQDIRHMVSARKKCIFERYE